MDVRIALNNALGGQVNNIPIYLSEDARSGASLPVIPLIELTFVDNPIEVHDIGGERRFEQQRIDINIYCLTRIQRDDTENALISKIRSISPEAVGCDFICESILIQMPENVGKQIIYRSTLSVIAERWV